MNDLTAAFEGAGGEALMAWCVEYGGINEDLGENATKLIEHNLIMKLFDSAGIVVTPMIPKVAPVKKKLDINIIDEVLTDG